MVVVLANKGVIPSSVFPMVYELAVATDHAERDIVKLGALVTSYPWLSELQMEGDWVANLDSALYRTQNELCPYFIKCMRSAWRKVPRNNTLQGRPEVEAPITELV
jgi:hypothetical protein